MTSQKFASQSFEKPYACQKPWPEDCFVQCGASGIVISNPSYRTAFFEAFPLEPKTFIRGQGDTIEEAEASCFDKWQSILSCDGHDYRRHGEQHGICKKCGLFTSNVFLPEAKCDICGKEHVSFDLNKRKLCFQHYMELVVNVLEEYKQQKLANVSFTYYQNLLMTNHSKTFLECKLLLKFHLLDCLVEHQIKENLKRFEDGFDTFKGNVDKHLFDLFKEEDETIKLMALLSAKDKVSNDLEIYSNLFLLYLNKKEHIQEYVDEDVILDMYIKKVEYFLQNPNKDEED